MKSADQLSLENAVASGDVKGNAEVSEAPAAETAPASRAAPFAEPPSGSTAAGESPPPAANSSTEAAGHQAETLERGASPIAVEASGAAAEVRLGDALAALDRRDYATAKRLFAAVGREDAAEAIEKALAALDRKDYPTAQGLFEALALPKGPPASQPAPPAVHAKAEEQPAASLPVVPFVEPEDRAPAPLPKKGRSRLLALAACLAILAIIGAAWLGAMRQNASLAAAKSGAFSVFASALGLVKAPLAAGAEAGKEEDPIVDLRSRLDQANNRLERIERETGARLDKLGERIDETSAKSAEPAASTSGATTDVAARLERLEKSVISAPASDLGDVTARLDKLEKKIAADAATGAKLAEVTARLDKLEKRVSAQTAAQTATGAAPLPPSRAGSAQSQAPSDPAASSRRVLQNYAVEDVQDGVAVVASRYGAQQVAPGDFLPGAGRVLRIERRGGDWYVVTSNGVIAGAQSQQY